MGELKDHNLLGEKNNEKGENVVNKSETVLEGGMGKWKIKCTKTEMLPLKTKEFI